MNSIQQIISHNFVIVVVLCLLAGFIAAYKVIKGFLEIRQENIKRAKRKAKKQKNKEGETALLTERVGKIGIKPEDEVKATTIPTSPSQQSKDIMKDIGDSNEFMVLRKEKKKFKIVIADDSKTARYTIKDALSPRHFEIYEAVDGAEAYQMIMNREPDLLITDIEMPNMDGFELLRRVRTNLKFSQLPVLMLTGNLDIHVEIGDKQGANGFLTKPYDKKDLVDQVEYLLHF